MACFGNWVPGIYNVSNPNMEDEFPGVSRMLNVSSAVECQSRCQTLPAKNCSYFAWEGLTESQSQREEACLLMSREFVKNRINFIVGSSVPSILKSPNAECGVAIASRCESKQLDCLKCEEKPRCVTLSPIFIAGPRKCRSMLRYFL